MALFALGLAVFLWGTSYKLSLYKRDQKDQTPVKLSTSGGDSARQTVWNVIEKPATAEPEQHPNEFGVPPELAVLSELPKLSEWQVPPPLSAHVPIELSLRPPPASSRTNV